MIIIPIPMGKGPRGEPSVTLVIALLAAAVTLPVMFAGIAASIIFRISFPVMDWFSPASLRGSASGCSSPWSTPRSAHSGSGGQSHDPARFHRHRARARDRGSARRAHSHSNQTEQIMKWFLVLYFAGLGGQGQMAATSIGPYDTRDGCMAVGSQMALKDGWKGFCYPVGEIPLKKPDAATEKKPGGKKNP